MYLMLHSFGLMNSSLPQVNYWYLRFHEQCPSPQKYGVRWRKWVYHTKRR